jgi:hypothetical protein
MPVDPIKASVDAIRIRALALLEIMFLIPLFLGITVAAANPVERWAKAVGGRKKVAAIKSIYREGTLEYSGAQGTIKVWHTADGKYRKEEKVAGYSLIETFDGVNGAVQQGTAPPHKMTDAELRLATSRRFANANAMLFAFFPERRHGSLDIEPDGTIVLKPDGGIEWRVTLDPQTWLPKTMVHQEGRQTITVTLDSYETIGGIKFEKEIHRSAGDPSRGAVIHFTKTIINPPIDASLFSIPSK